MVPGGETGTEMLFLGCEGLELLQLLGCSGPWQAIKRNRSGGIGEGTQDRCNCPNFCFLGKNWLQHPWLSNLYLFPENA